MEDLVHAIFCVMVKIENHFRVSLWRKIEGKRKCFTWRGKWEKFGDVPAEGKVTLLWLMNSNMFKPKKFDHFHLVYHFTVPLRIWSFSITDNKAFWKTITPFISSKAPSLSRITLIENEAIISDGQRLAETLSKFFAKAIVKLDIKEFKNISNIDGLSDPLENAIKKSSRYYCYHWKV